jgi:hypothetical protein
MGHHVDVPITTRNFIPVAHIGSLNWRHINYILFAAKNLLTVYSSIPLRAA